MAAAVEGAQVYVDTAMEIEGRYFVDLVTGQISKNMIQAFFFDLQAVSGDRGRPAEIEPWQASKVVVLGAGMMGAAIAYVCAKAGMEVVLKDVDQAAADRGKGYSEKLVAKGVQRGKTTQEKGDKLLSLITATTDPAAAQGADLVIEAVFEEMSVKQQVFAEVEAVVSAECVLATNTSALSVTEMASKLEHPERVVGLHFFNPVAVLPLLEVVRAEQTDDASLATAFAVGKALKKSCVLVADAPAFVVNRLLTRFLGEITAAVERGTPVTVADRALDPLGLPMTPFELLSLVGPPVALHVAERMHEAFPDRFAVGDGLRRMVELGKASVYSEPGVVDPDLAGIDAGDDPLTEAQVRENAERALAEEIRLMLDEGVVQAVQDIDLCMLLGAGWPFWLGGISPYLDRAGVAEAVTGERFLPKGVASLPA
jgi:3-hydroxyacyl-CoA dehydrogenase